MKERIIIIGGGFAGLKIAQKLSGKTDKEIMIIDMVNHHMFQPLFYQVASGRLEPSNISFPFRKIFQNSKNVRFRMTRVEKIIPEEKKVICTDGVFDYTELIIATGCKTNFFGNENIEKNSYGMKNTHEAINIRNKILLTFEKLIIEREKSSEGSWNIVIIGSGPTGVELAGAFAEMKKNILPKDYPNMDFSPLRIIMISTTPTPLTQMSKEAQEKSEFYLKQLGVEFLNNEIVTDYDGKIVKMQSGKEIPTDNLIWGAGVIGNIIDGLNPEVIERRRYKVDRFHRVLGYENIYAVGDIAYMSTEKYPNAHPQVASVAIAQAKNLALNLLKKDKKNWKKFEYKDRGSMATIGKNKAVVDLPNWKFQGVFAWYFWMFLHLMLILGVRNKVATFFNWMWSYINQDSSLRLITSETKKNKK